MAKKQKRKRNKVKNKFKGVHGWLAIVLIIFTISALNASYLLIQRINWLFTLPIGTGVYISMLFLLIYCPLIWYSIYLIMEHKKKAIKFSIIALIAGFIFNLWFYLVGLIILSQVTRLIIYNGISTILFNLILILIIISYLKKSKRVKATLIR